MFFAALLIISAIFSIILILSMDYRLRGNDSVRGTRMDYRLRGNDNVLGASMDYRLRGNDSDSKTRSNNHAYGNGKVRDNDNVEKCL